jgi:hypothetical protein
VQQKEGDATPPSPRCRPTPNGSGRLGDQGGVGEALRQRAMVEIFAERLDEAEASAIAALDAFEAVGERAGEGWALQNLAWTAFVTGRPDAADEHLQAAVAMFDETPTRAARRGASGLLAWVRFQQRRMAEAEALGEQVLAEAEARSDPWATSMMTAPAARRCGSGRGAPSTRWSWPSGPSADLRPPRRPLRHAAGERGAGSGARDGRAGGRGPRPARRGCRLPGR